MISSYGFWFDSYADALGVFSGSDVGSIGSVWVNRSDGGVQSFAIRIILKLQLSNIHDKKINMTTKKEKKIL